MAADNDIKLAMIELAKSVAKAAAIAEPLGDKIDALKTLTAVYAALNKHKSDDPDEDQGDGFDFSKGVNPEEPPNGVTALRTRRRPG